MATPLKFSIVILMTIALATHHADSQLSTIATELSQIIKLLEEITNKSTSYMPDIAVALHNHEMRFGNNTATLEEISTTLSKIEKVMMLQREKQEREMSISTQTYQNIVSQISRIQDEQLNQMIIGLERQNQHFENISSVLPQLISLLEMQQDTTAMDNLSENSAVGRIVATQARMADSLDQIVSLLQIKERPLLHTLPTVAMTTDKPTTQPPIIHRDCSDIPRASNHGSRVYTIDPKDGQGSFDVYCNMDIDEGGWTVFQKRFDGSVDFYLGWDDYENGFGNLHGEHWLGLQKMHRMTSSGRWTLRIDLEDFDGNTGYAQYEDFQIRDAESFYRLSLGTFSGNISDAMNGHNGMSFTTKDQDHDTYLSGSPYNGNCALWFQGAWWYYGCVVCNLNGLYKGSSTVLNHEASKMSWISSPFGYNWLKKSEMKMRRTQ